MIISYIYTKMISQLELNARRLKLKRSQREFANMLGITQEHYNRLENGKLPISMKTERRYSELFSTYRSRTFRLDRRVTCPHCKGNDLKKLGKSTKPEYAVWRCRSCGRYFSSAEAWYLELSSF